MSEEQINIAINIAIEKELLDALEILRRERDEAREKAERYRLEANAMMLQRDEARAATKLAYCILANVNRPSREAAYARSAIKHVNDTPMDWLQSLIQKWKEGAK